MKQVIQSENILAENETVQKAKGDPRHFRPLYEKYFKTIFLFVLHRIGEKEITADITSQIFLKALMNIKKYSFRGLPFSSWLYRIAVNECNNYFRNNKRSRLVVLEEYHAETLYEEMFGDEFREELRQKLPSVLERLKEEELQLIELRFLEGRPFREIAEILNITETYAKVRTYRILDKMKKIFTGK